MTTFYTLGARLSGMAAVVCAVLAMLAHPGQARADDPYDACKAYCGGNLTCEYLCVQQGGPPSCTTGACDNGCGMKSSGNCSGGACNKVGKNSCTACKCSDAALGSPCECL